MPVFTVFGVPSLALLL